MSKQTIRITNRLNFRAGQTIDIDGGRHREVRKITALTAHTLTVRELHLWELLILRLRQRYYLQAGYETSLMRRGWTAMSPTPMNTARRYGA